MTKGEAAPSANRPSPSDRARKAARASHATGRRKAPAHPSTSVGTHDTETTEFLLAIHQFQRDTGRKFPTWGDVLHVLKGLGYEKTPAASVRKTTGVAS